MSARFAELAWQQTPIGELSLRRRHDQALDVDIYEVKLGEEFLMSSLFTVAEIELANLGIAAVGGANGNELEVLVGGLGLGYTAQAALAFPRVASVVVVDALLPVIEWHQQGLLPVSASLVSDPRTTLVHDDYFDLMRRPPLVRYDAMLIDIDHSPRHQLDGGHADFYTVDGLRLAAAHLKEGGVFALWSDDPPDDEYLAVLRQVFAEAEGHAVPFPNPVTGGVSSNSVYVAR